MSAAASRATRRALSSVLAAAASASASASSAGGGVAATTTTMMSSHGRGALFATLRAATAAHHRESSSLRGFASSASASAETSSSPGIFEFRTDVVIPANRNDYLATCYEREYREARVSIHEGAFLGMWTVETGGDLNEITHVYHYRDYDHRDVVRANVKGAKDEEAWACFQADAWPYVKSMKSEIFLPATNALAAGGVAADAHAHLASVVAADAKDNGVFEMRRYQLELGYNPVPKLIEHMSEGLPSKLAADEVRSMSHWSPYDRVGVVNADP